MKALHTFFLLSLLPVSALAAPPFTARAEELISPALAEGVEWGPQAVLAPVRRSELRVAPPFVQSKAKEVTGEVEVGPEEGAVFFLGSLETVRVKADPTVRFTRVPVAMQPDRSLLEIEERGIPARAGLYYLAEPIGDGSLWFITASKKTTISLERPRAVDQQLTGEAARAAIRACLNEERTCPRLARHPEVAAELQSTEALAKELTAAAPELKPAVESFRLASVLKAYEHSQPITTATFSIDELTLPGPTDALSDDLLKTPWSVQTKEGKHSVTLEGPGLLAIDARALVVNGETDVTLKVKDGDRVLEELSLRKTASYASDDGRGALPDARPLRTLSGGAPVGLLEQARVFLTPEPRTYTIEWSGGPLALRVRRAERRPFLHEAWDGEADWRDAANKGLRELKASDKPLAALLRHELRLLLDDRTESASFSVKGPALVEALAAIATVEHRPDAERTKRAIAAVDTLDSRSPSAWRMRLRLVRALAKSGHVSEAEALIAKADGLPDSAWLLYSAADALSLLPAEDSPAQLGLLELAWRREPLSDDIRRRYRSVFYEQTRWSAVPPAPSKAGTVAAASRWLDIEPVLENAPDGNSLALAVLASGQKAHVKVDNKAGASLRAWVLPADVGGELSLNVGDATASLAPITPVEQVDFALPKGEEDVSVKGHGRAFVESTFVAEPNGGPDQAFLRSAWPVMGAKTPTHFHRVGAGAPVPLRVQLRAMGDKPVVLWMHTDAGTAQRLVLNPVKANPNHLSLSKEGLMSPAAASGVFVVPSLAKELWFEPEDKAAEVFASVSARTGLAPPRVAERPVPLPPASEKDLHELSELSKKLNAGATPRLLLDRAQLLIRFNEPFLAKLDLLKAADDELSASESKELSTLSELAEDQDDAQIHLVQPVIKPTLLSPGYAELSGADRTEDVAKLAREKGPAAALAELSAPATVRERWLRARLLLATGQPEQATSTLVQLALETGSPRVSIDAVRSFDAMKPLTDGWRAQAPFMLPLSDKLAEWADVGAVRRVRANASRTTRWDTVRDAELSAGSEQASGIAPQEELPELVRKALLGPTFDPHEGSFVRTGDSAVLDVPMTAANSYGAQIVCGSVPGTAQPTPCELHLRVDGRETGSKTFQPNEEGAVEFGALKPGRHQVEVTTMGGGLSLLRFVDHGAAVATQRPTAFHRSLPSDPVQITVNGPAVVRVHVRSIGDGTQRQARVEVSSAQVKSTQTIAIPDGVDQTVTVPKTTVSGEAVQWISLPNSGPQRLTVKTDRGELLVRAEVGSATRDAPLVSQLPSLRSAELNAETAELAWPALPPPMVGLPGESAVDPYDDGIGMISGTLAMRSEALPEDEKLPRPPRTGLESRIGFRREFADKTLFLHAEPIVRVPFGSSAVIGGQLAAYARDLPAGLRAYAIGSIYTQTVNDLLRMSVEGRGIVDRSFQITRSAWLIPAVWFTAETFRGITTATEMDQVDRYVYSRYGDQHRRRLTPTLSLRWMPLQDQVGAVTTRLTSNQDLATVDNWTNSAHWTALLGGPLRLVRAQVGYELSDRLKDTDRSEQYLRHTVFLHADRSIWTSGAGRVLLFAEDAVQFSAPLGTQNLFTLGARWDFTGGRGLSDLMPTEEEFDQLVESGRFAE
ncbi:MAG: hypothetical protein ACJ790_10210 [Myxococcaceae bacterium]